MSEMRCFVLLVALSVWAFVCVLKDLVDLTFVFARPC